MSWLKDALLFTAGLYYGLDESTQGYLRALDLFTQRARSDGLAAPLIGGEQTRDQVRALVTAQVLPARRDWRWPYWAVRQYDPADAGFQAGGATGAPVNRTRRAWTLLGMPGQTLRATVDPRGLVTPWPRGDGWSLDTWIVRDGKVYGAAELPAGAVTQSLRLDPPTVVTEWAVGDWQVTHEALVAAYEREDWVLVTVSVRNMADMRAAGALWLALRPYNPEGVAHTWRVEHRGSAWYVNGRIALVTPPHRVMGAWNLLAGDLDEQLNGLGYAFDQRGLVGGVAAYPCELDAGQTQTWTVAMPLASAPPFTRAPLPLQWGVKLQTDTKQAWQTYLSDSLELELPDARWQAAFEAQKRYSLLAWGGNRVVSGGFVTPGARVREAAYVVSALDHLGLHVEAEQVFRGYLARLRSNGYCDDGSGRLATNGQLLWALGRHHYLTGNDDFAELALARVLRAALWISYQRKAGPREPEGEELLPAGPSDMHAGAHQYNFADNLWGVAGLRATAALLKSIGHASAERYTRLFTEYWDDLQHAWQVQAERLGRAAPPHTPGAALTGAAIESLLALAPLRLVPPQDARMNDLLAFLAERSLGAGAYFDESGALGYSVPHTFQLAQAYLQRGTPELAWPLIAWALAHASPTWAWPLGVHPATGMGAAGDGHATWSGAEWVHTLRLVLIQEEGTRLVLTPGAPPEWWVPGAIVRVRHAPTAFGRVSFEAVADAEGVRLSVTGRWRTAPSAVVWRVARGGAVREVVVDVEGEGGAAAVGW